MSSGNLKKVNSAEGLVRLTNLNPEPVTELKPANEAHLPPAATRRRLRPLEIAVMIAVSILVLLASHFAWWPIGVTEG
jgi:hypothetical protein